MALISLANGLLMLASGPAEGRYQPRRSAEVDVRLVKRVAEKCRGLQRNAEICTDLQRFAEKCRDLHRFAEKCSQENRSEKKRETIKNTEKMVGVAYFRFVAADLHHQLEDMVYQGYWMHQQPLSWLQQRK